MKALFLFLFMLIFPFQLHSMDTQIFKDGYPLFFNFNNILLADLKNFFEALPNNSLIYPDKNGKCLFRVRKENGELINIYSRIERTISPNQISERVFFILDNGNLFQYDLLRKGQNLIPSEDEDLLSLNVMPKDEDFFQMSLPAFKVFISFEKKSSDHSVAFFNIGLFDMSLQIEKNITEQSAYLNYIYFFKAMPNPQSSLTVRAYKTQDEWASVQYLFYSGQGAQLTPKQFFGGLADGSRAFGEASYQMGQSLNGLGFPSL